jgi:hypothetical protein
MGPSKSLFIHVLRTTVLTWALVDHWARNSKFNQTEGDIGQLKPLDYLLWTIVPTTPVCDAEKRWPELGFCR